MEKRTILVTGGNRGIGLATVEGVETAVYLANLPSSAPSGSFFRDKSEIPW